MVLSSPDETLQTSSASNPSATNGANLQNFTGALGGVAAPAVTTLGNSQFQVDGNSAFKTQQNAIERSWCANSVL
jgi:hypothetical protein